LPGVAGHGLGEAARRLRQSFAVGGGRLGKAVPSRPPPLAKLCQGRLAAWRGVAEQPVGRSTRLCHGGGNRCQASGLPTGGSLPTGGGLHHYFVPLRSRSPEPRCRVGPPVGARPQSRPPMSPGGALATETPANTAGPGAGGRHRQRSGGGSPASQSQRISWGRRLRRRRSISDGMELPGRGRAAVACGTPRRGVGPRP